MLLLRLAMRNLLRTGVRLWLNALVIAISIVIILFSRGIYAGLGHEMLHSLEKTEVAGGHLWAKGFDPLDNTTFDLSLASVPESVQKAIKEGKACSQLYANGTLYYHGKVLPVTLRGIEPGQEVLSLPTKKLAQAKANGAIPVLLGLRMSDVLGLADDDTFVIKWRDSKGVFDGADFKVVELMDTVNPRVDSNTIWLSTERLQQMLVAKGKATCIIVKKEKYLSTFHDVDEALWQRKNIGQLTAWVHRLVQDKEKGGRIIFMLLIFLACVGIFNSQTLAVFKRRKEIGMLMALGLRRRQVIRLFTYEGVITSFLALGLAFMIGAPLLYWTSTTGLLMDHIKGTGAPIPERLRTHYSPELIVVTIAIIFFITTFVSWYPTAKIAKMSPVKALTGRH